jgi:uncharacterized protein YjbI with pentapeptide repeats
MCRHAFSTGEVCSRRSRLQEYCGFHALENHPDRYSDRRYLKNLKVLLRNKDCDWREFKFPAHIYANDISVDAQIDVSGAEFFEIKLEKVQFHTGVHAVKIKVGGRVDLLQVNFDGDLSLQSSEFVGDVLFRSFVVEGTTNFSGCIFRGEFDLNGRLQHSKFNHCEFLQAVRFKQTKNVTLSAVSGTFSMSGQVATLGATGRHSPLGGIKKYKLHLLKVSTDCLKRQFLSIWKPIADYHKSVNLEFSRFIENLRKRFPYMKNDTEYFYLFEGVTHFENVLFTAPKLVEFDGVDLSKVIFSGTDLKDITFIGNNWWQQELGRSGLYEDALYNKHTDYHILSELMPRLENSYRNIRLSLENIKDFSRANDFFVGEMSAQRRQLPFFQRNLLSVNALYYYFSNYGTSPTKCLLWFLLLAFFQSILIVWIGGMNSPVALHDFWNTVYQVPLNLAHLKEEICAGADWLFKVFIFSLENMTLQKPDIPSGVEQSSLFLFIKFVFSIVGPINAGLLALTIRARIKRH